ncbi:Pol protein [Phytophthora palmivora]|uniref:Pol protein n=1 Tax=Phytophthora palmivora TaxID=4796 RepID=A0A2P4YQN6_9STRA|nr:Pol protein [Phytophthora palmivora]
MDFVFGLPKDSAGNTGVVLFVDRLSKMAHLAAVPDTIDGTISRSPEKPVASLKLAYECISSTYFSLEDILRSVCAETPKRWSAMLPVVEFAMNNAVHASTGFTPFYVNGLTHPRVPLTPSRRDSGLDGGEAEWLADVSPTAVRKQVDDFLSLRLSVLRHVRDAMAERRA